MHIKFFLYCFGISAYAGIIDTTDSAHPIASSTYPVNELQETTVKVVTALENAIMSTFVPVINIFSSFTNSTMTILLDILTLSPKTLNPLKQLQLVQSVIDSYVDEAQIQGINVEDFISRLQSSMSNQFQLDMVKLDKLTKDINTIIIKYPFVNLKAFLEYLSINISNLFKIYEQEEYLLKNMIINPFSNELINNTDKLASNFLNFSTPNMLTYIEENSLSWIPNIDQKFAKVTKQISDLIAELVKFESMKYSYIDDNKTNASEFADQTKLNSSIRIPTENNLLMNFQQAPNGNLSRYISIVPIEEFTKSNNLRSTQSNNGLENNFFLSTISAITNPFNLPLFTNISEIFDPFYLINPFKVSYSSTTQTTPYEEKHTDYNEAPSTYDNLNIYDEDEDHDSTITKNSVIFLKELENLKPTFIDPENFLLVLNNIIKLQTGDTKPYNIVLQLAKELSGSKYSQELVDSISNDIENKLNNISLKQFNEILAHISNVIELRVMDS